MKKILDHSSDLILFSYLIEYGSFTELADRLEINKSIISKRITNLEKELGTQLLIRSTRLLKPTDAGLLLYEQCKKVQDDLEALYSKVSDINHAEHGNIRISAPSSFAYECLSLLIANFSKMYPKIRLKLLAGRTFVDIAKHRIDIGFHLGPPPDSNLIGRKVGESRLIACASPQFLATQGTPKTPQELESLNCLRFIQGDHLNQWIFIPKDGAPIGVDVNGNFHSSSSQLLKSSAINHVGIIMLPDYQVNDALRNGQLIQVLPEYETKHFDIHILYNQTQYMPHRLRLFIDKTIEFFKHDFSKLKYLR